MPTPRDQMTNFPTNRRYLREIWQPDIRPEIAPHLDFHIGTLTNDFVAQRRRLFGFLHGESEPVEVSLTAREDLDWIGPSEGPDWGPCVRDGKRAIYRLFADGYANWRCPQCARRDVKSAPAKKRVTARDLKAMVNKHKLAGRIPNQKEIEAEAALLGPYHRPELRSMHKEATGNRGRGRPRKNSPK